MVNWATYFSARVSQMPLCKSECVSGYFNFWLSLLTHSIHRFQISIILSKDNPQTWSDKWANSLEKVLKKIEFIKLSIKGRGQIEKK